MSKFYINNQKKIPLKLHSGVIYVFDQSKPENEGHPIFFSTIPNGSHNLGEMYLGNDEVKYLIDDVEISSSEYIDKLTNDFSSIKSAQVLVRFSEGTPTNLFYYCHNHSGMGGKLTVIKKGTSTLQGDCPLPEPGTLPGSGTPGHHNPCVKKCLDSGVMFRAPWHTLKRCPGTDDNGNMNSDTTCYGDCVQDCHDKHLFAFARRKCVDKCRCERAQRAYACYQQFGYVDPDTGECGPNPPGNRNIYCACLAKYCKSSSDPTDETDQGNPCQLHMFPRDCGCGPRRPNDPTCPCYSS